MVPSWVMANGKFRSARLSKIILGMPLTLSRKPSGVGGYLDSSQMMSL